MRNYVFDHNHQVVAVDDPLVWAEWLDRTDRTVKKTTLGGKLVSTVFLGMDHSFGTGEPLVFETMIFPEGGPLLEEYCDRYSTWAEAEAGHEKAVAMVRQQDRDGVK